MYDKLKELLIKLKKDEYKKYDEADYQTHLCSVLNEIYGYGIDEFSQELSDKYYDKFSNISLKNPQKAKQQIISLVEEIKEDLDISLDLCNKYVEKFLDFNIGESCKDNIEDFMNTVEKIELVQHALYVKFKNNTFTLVTIPRDIFFDFCDKNTYLSTNGLNPCEILMLSYAPKLKVKNTAFQRFWEMEYNINPQQVIDKLFKEEFINYGTVEDALNFEKSTTLSEILKTANLPVTGKKDVLIKRIIDNIPREKLQQLNIDIHYALTKKGREELAQNEYVNYVHSHCCRAINPDVHMDIWKMNFISKGQPYFPFEDYLR